MPTALETPHWETDNTVTPSPHHPIGAKGVGESPNVGSPQAFVNAVMDALAPLGITTRYAVDAREGVACDTGRRSDDVNLEWSGQESIPVSKDAVWAFINDPAKVGACLPDVQSMTVRDAHNFDATVGVAVGPVRGKFTLRSRSCRPRTVVT